jgi:hypothetical protein
MLIRNEVSIILTSKHPRAMLIFGSAEIHLTYRRHVTKFAVSAHETYLSLNPSRAVSSRRCENYTTKIPTLPKVISSWKWDTSCPVRSSHIVAAAPVSAFLRSHDFLEPKLVGLAIQAVDCLVNHSSGPVVVSLRKKKKK